MWHDKGRPCLLSHGMDPQTLSHRRMMRTSANKYLWVVVRAVAVVRVEILLQVDAELFAKRLQLVQIFLILLCVLDLFFNGCSVVRQSSSRDFQKRKRSPTLKYSHGRREVVDTSGSFQGCGDDTGRGHEIVGEGVVQIPLRRTLEPMSAEISCSRHTCSSNTSWTPSNSFSYLCNIISAELQGTVGLSSPFQRRPVHRRHTTELSRGAYRAENSS
jgi:hypothetical protein